MSGEQGTQQRKTSDIWRKGDLVPYIAGMRCVVAVYVGGLLACIIAGGTAPDLFISKQAVLSPPGGISSASSDFVFDMSGYKRTHQSIFFSMRLNKPIELQQAMDINGSTTISTVNDFNITLYGSPEPTITSLDCPTGCVSCPDGSEELGLTCSLITYEIVGKDVVTCTAEDDWCSWSPLYNVHFVSFATYYWVVKTDNDLNSFVEDADSAVDWMSQFRVIFVSQWWTGFEMVWFYVWVCMTLLAMFTPEFGFFTVALSGGVCWSEWSRQQKWVGLLLPALLFFNNPLFAAQIFSQHAKELFVWYAFAQGAMVGLLLLYWLNRLVEAGRGPEGGWNNEGVALAAQCILATLIFIAFVVNMIHLRISREGNPDRVHSYPYSSTGVEQVLTILCFVYCAWVILLAARAWWWGGGADLLRESPRLNFFLGSSTVTVMVVVPSIVLEHLSPRARGGIAFTIAHGTVNLYVLAMALLCAPRAARPPPVDAIGSGTAVNGIHQTPLPEGGEEAAPGPCNPGPRKWWKPKSRPKIADSSVWEDMQPGTTA